MQKFQRRWFILYSNGELTYSLDRELKFPTFEHLGLEIKINHHLSFIFLESSLTLPQNRIQLTECDHISLAPDVHEYAIAIVYLDKVYYIRANHLDEMQRWFDDLSQFLTSKTTSIVINTLTNNFTNNLIGKQLGTSCAVVDAVHKTREPISLNDPRDQENNQDDNIVQCDQINQSSEKGVPKRINPVFKLLSYVKSDHQPNSNQVLITSEKMSCQDDLVIKSPKRNKSLPDLRTPKVVDQNTKENEKIVNSSVKNRNCQNQKSGWLMRRKERKSWFRHWFVLKDTLLTYYRDRATAEKFFVSNSLLDGVLDLSLVKGVHCSSSCLTLNQTVYYPFTITTFKTEHELASLSSLERDEWIRLIVDCSQSEINFISSLEREKTQIDKSCDSKAPSTNVKNSGKYIFYIRLKMLRHS